MDVTDLLKQIKLKIDKIRKLTDKMKILNFKMDALNTSLECYSGIVDKSSHLGENEDKLDGEETMVCQVFGNSINHENKSKNDAWMSFNDTISNGNSQYLNSADTQSMGNTQYINPTHIQDVTGTIIGQHTGLQQEKHLTYEKFIAIVLPHMVDPSVKRNSQKVLSLLFENEIISLDEIVKEAKIPRFKVVEVINVLLKINPPVIRKSFNRVFYYSVIRDM